MTAYQVLLILLLVGSVVFSLVAAATRDLRWSSTGVALLALVFLCQNVHSLS